MATLALARRELTATELMARLRVKQLGTVRHYAKHGVMQRRMSFLGAQHRKAGETLLRDPDLNPFVRILGLLRSLRALRSP